MPTPELIERVASNPITFTPTVMMKLEHCFRLTDAGKARLMSYQTKLEQTCELRLEEIQLGRSRPRDLSCDLVQGSISGSLKRKGC